jgi:tetratricopeptide (TPR) repeat protein
MNISNLLSKLRFVCIAAMMPLLLCAQAPQEDAAAQLRNESYRAYSMHKRAMSYLEAGNTEAGIKLLQDVPKLFPTAEARFKSFLALGEHYMTEQVYEESIAHYAEVKTSEDAEERAEALHKIGICQYHMNKFDKSFVSLRKVTTEYPWTVWANESFYYIGLCHFKLKRWTRAYEALRLVGVSVQTNVDVSLAECGRRLWVKVGDKDLVVLTRQDKQELPVQVITKSGDKETLVLLPHNDAQTEYIGSIETDAAPAVEGDGTLQFLGPDRVEVSYVDETTAEGTSDSLLASVDMVSTATVGFTDGAFRDYVQGVRGDQLGFIRLKDIDRSTSTDPETIGIRVFTQYKIEPTEEDLIGINLDNQEDLFRERDSINITLTEADGYSGIFQGQVRPVLLPDREEGDGVTVEVEESAIDREDDTLSARTTDEIVVEYTDETHIGGLEPRVITYSTLVLDNIRNDVEISQWVVEDADLKARKNLIESRIFLRLGQIFKEVGLNAKATEKAEEGLERVEAVIRSSLDHNLKRTLLEDAFNVKWDLLLVQDNLSQAVAVCNALLRLFPNSRVADQALMRIGTAKVESAYPDEWRSAVNVFRSVMRIQKSELKAEAAYRIAEATEKIGFYQQRDREEQAITQGAISAYKACADAYPESAFAGRALEKVVQYYIDTEDYPRAVDLMELIVQDFEDASFLDVILLKWAITAQKMGNADVALDKLNKLIAEYPNSKVVSTAMRFRNQLLTRVQ